MLSTFCREHVDGDANNSSGMMLACNLWARVALYIALYCACETIVEIAVKAATVQYGSACR